MTRAVPAALALGALIACSDTGGNGIRGPEVGAVASDTTGRPSTDTIGVKDAIGDPGDLGAPALLGPIRQQLDQMSADPQGYARSNLTSYKNLAATFQSAVLADLNRLGTGDRTAYEALVDSIEGDLGGGTGVAEGPTPEKIPAHVGRMRRLITLYEDARRGAPAR